MKEPGPSVPLPLKTPKTGTKRKHIETQYPNTPVVKNGMLPDSPLSTMSIDSRRSTASHRRNEEIIHSFPMRTTEKCVVFVFGAGSMGELGLGATGKDRDVKRPRLNGLLSSIGIVDVAVGGMHVAALDYEGRVWTWGVNDQGSLGRDTKVVDKEVAMKDDDSDDEEEEELNPLESKPGLVQGFPEGVQIVKLACGDSISVAIANDGKVYSWGTFRVCLFYYK
jgi:regulator of chromosome condensation